MKFRSKIVFISVATVLVMGVSFGAIRVLGNDVKADEDVLNEYQDIIDEFNLKYNTEFQFASPEVLSSEGSNKDELVKFFTSMSREEFWNYLYDAYMKQQENQWVDLSTAETRRVE